MGIIIPPYFASLPGSHPTYSYNKYSRYASLFSLSIYFLKYGGEEGIRTLVTIARKHAFQAGALNHSATSPAPRIIHQNYLFIKGGYSP